MHPSEGHGWSEMKNHSRRLRRHPGAANGQPANSQGKAEQPKGKGTKGSRTKKGAWGGETAGTNAIKRVEVVWGEAEPEGSADGVRMV
jgi:hypothetical protein